MKSFLLLLLVMVSCGTQAQTDSFRNKQPRRSLQSAAMRIFVDYTDSDNQWKSDPLVDKYVFSKKLMKKTIDFYTVFLKVKYPKETYTIPDVPGDGFTVKARTMSYDLHTYFKVYNRGDNSFAAAAPLSFDSFGRAIVGYFELNLNAITASKANMINHFGTFVHEFYHILVFNDALFSRFINAAGTPIGRSNLVTDSFTLGGKSRVGYKGTNVLSWAKTYLSDPNLASVVMENDGGSGSAGSHWEHMYWPTDFMSPIDTTPSLHSQLSFNMAVDSGWFVVDLTLAEELTYGKSAGANFQSGGCPSTAKGFCVAADATSGKISCSPDWRYKAKCYTDPTYSETCYFLFATAFCSIDDAASNGSNVDSAFEYLGVDGRCVMTKKLGNEADYQAACSKPVCGSNEITYTFKSGATCSCPSSKDDQEATCTGGSTTTKIKCPNTNDRVNLCRRLEDGRKCPNDCNGNGICLGDYDALNSRRCFCMYGFAGPGCADSNPNELESKITTWATVTPAILKDSLLAAVMMPLIAAVMVAYI